MVTLEREMTRLLVRCADCGAVSGWTVLCFRCSGTDLEVIGLDRVAEGPRGMAPRMPHDELQQGKVPRDTRKGW